MNYKKLLNTAVLASIICMIGVSGIVQKAEAWSWKGFSALTVEDKFRGPEGIIVFTLREATVYTQCFNVNTDNLAQPGVGNGGDAGIVRSFDTEPTKAKGVVSFKGDIELSIFDVHHNNPDHFHTCHPYENVNKVEIEGTAWIAEFVADWVLYDDNMKVKNSGTDTCTWNGEIIIDEEGIPRPEHNAPFTCEEVSTKKINYYIEK
jgi:hypothetical protein